MRLPNIVSVLQSRPVELGLVSAVGVSTLYAHPLVAPMTLAAVSAKLVLERALRWQFAPAACAFGIGQLSTLAPASAVWLSWLLRGISWLLLALSLALVLIFPQPAGPPAFTGQYGVAFLDAEVEVASPSAPTTSVLLRVLYPIDKGLVGQRGGAAYYDLQGRRLCRAMMKKGTPGFLSRLYFLMDHLALIRSPLHAGGPALPMAATSAPVTTVVWSHGLLSCREQYLAIVGELASRGCVVLCVEHTDGTCVLARRPDGSAVEFASDAHALEDRTPEGYIHARRAQVELRSVEMVAALEAARALATPAADTTRAAPSVAPAPAQRCVAGVSAEPATGSWPTLRPGRHDVGGAAALVAVLAGRLDSARVVCAGHSMGGVTCVAGAVRAPYEPRAVVVLDPATNWGPSLDCREALVGAGAREATLAQAAGHRELLPGQRGLGGVPMLACYSDQWRELGWGLPRQVRAHMAAVGFGAGSEFAYVKGITHVGMSDVPSTMPPRIARAMQFLNDDATAEQSLLRVRGKVVAFLERQDLCKPALHVGPRALAAVLESDESYLLDRLYVPWKDDARGPNFGPNAYTPPAL
jgi:pimeloyl-ACP methyl ester carboxylesterase